MGRRRVDQRSARPGGCRGAGISSPTRTANVKTQTQNVTRETDSCRHNIAIFIYNAYVRRGRLNVPVPRLVTCLRHYSWPTFAADALAGVTVGFVALPLAMAFAIASGLSPQSGLYCAIVAGGLISLLGGSRVQIGGPTGAFVVIVAGIAARYGVDGLFMCTMLAGGILIALGVTGMGSAIRFIPRPVVVGFTNGIAVLIASTQIRDFLGLKMASVPSEFLPRMRALLQAAGTWSPAATALSVAALVCIIVAARISRRMPGSI